VTSSGALLFVFSTPESVLAVVASEFTTGNVDWTCITHCFGRNFAAHSTFRSFSGDTKEQGCSTLA
jgi:hypothetical protein